MRLRCTKCWQMFTVELRRERHGGVWARVPSDALVQTDVRLGLIAPRAAVEVSWLPLEPPRAAVEVSWLPLETSARRAPWWFAAA